MKAIQSFLKFRPSEDYVIRESNLPWLRLSIDVPSEDIYQEFLAVRDEFVPHRQNDKLYNLTNHLWSSLTLYGESSKITTESSGRYDWTDIADICPKTKNWINENFLINEDTGRIRFMLLEAGGYILPHIDRTTSKLSEINVAITQPNGCVFRFLDKGNIPFQPGTAFIIDTSNKHMVVNQSNEDRLHMILHTRLKKGVIGKSYEDSFYNQ